MRGHRTAWYLLLLVPYVALLWVPFYAKATPKLFGFPFFYWYQFLWVILSALITLAVYVLTRPAAAAGSEGEAGRTAPGGGGVGGAGT